jgi:predicted secreted protein
MKRSAIAAAAWLALTGNVHAADNAPTPVPVLSISASATTSVANDRMFGSLRIEAENSDPARAAAEVNAKMGKALARAKATAGVDASTSGYSSYQLTDKLITRWHVVQSLSLQSSDFATMAALLTKLQSEDGMLLSGMSFGVSPDARRKAEDALTQQAIKAWQARAQNAVRGFGFESWRTGRVSIDTGEPVRPQPMMRVQAMSAGGAPPVQVEGGNTDVSVTVSGEVVVEGARK